MTGMVIKEIFTYLLFLGIVGKLAYSERDMTSYWFRKDLVNMFQGASYSEGGMAFHDVRNFVCYLVLFVEKSY